MKKFKLILLSTLLAITCGNLLAETQRYKCTTIAPEEYPAMFRCENNEMICFIYDSEDGLKCEAIHE
jgi:hypothetical protein